MAKNLFNHNVQLIPLNIKNAEQNTFRMELMNVPYLLYEVETLSTGEKIVINKPGGKRSWGRLSRNDFMVFIYSPDNEGLWLISHPEILEDLKLKYQADKKETEKLLKVYKWIWGQEDCNYPTAEGRWLSMNAILAEFNLKKD